MRLERLPTNPIIRLNMDDRLDGNINGPSVIRVPPWLPDPLGRYYCYFAHHHGTFIRLAYADDIAGPWSVYTPGVIDLRESQFSKHIASPDAHIDHERREVRLYYHGCCMDTPPTQVTRAATSRDGIHFHLHEEILGESYWRGFRWRDHSYGLVMPGTFYRSADPLTGYERGPTLFPPTMRHAAVQLVGDTLHIFWTNVGDTPERILMSTVNLTDDWFAWTASAPKLVLAPETAYEGAQLPLLPSQRGAILTPARQLRDPCILEDEGRTWLFYVVAGEQGIAVAELPTAAPSAF